MLMLLAIPVIVAVASAQRVLHAVAPSNMLIARMRNGGSNVTAGAALAVVASLSLLVTRLLTEAVAAGAPGWLNLAVLVLAWDTIKFGIASCLVFIGSVRTVARAAPTARDFPQNGRTCD